MSGAPTVVDIDRQAERLKRPFQMVRLEQVDDLAVDIYLCQGAIGWHRHVDWDELFITYSGFITLESEWGAVTLRPWEMVLVPKGVGHRSLSAWSSAVLLLRPSQLVDRKNGRRRLYGIPGEAKLRKVSLVGSAERPAMPFRPQFLTEVEDFSLRLLRCVGQGPRIGPRTGDTLLLVQRGTALLEVGNMELPLAGGELIRVPKHSVHRLIADTVTMIVELWREQPEGPASPKVRPQTEAD